MSPEATTIHLRCDRAGTWRVETDGATPETLSEHASETAAEAEALEHFGGRPGKLVIHDRYERVSTRPLRRAR